MLLTIVSHLKVKGCFNGGILRVGTDLGITWGGYIPPDKAVEYSDLFTSNLLCSEGDLTCMQSKEMTDILAQTHLLDIREDALLNFGSPWMPVMDSDFTPDTFLLGNPKDFLNTNEFNFDVEIIIGNRIWGI